MDNVAKAIVDAFKFKNFREELLKCMNRGCHHQTKACKDSSAEHVILNKGKRITLNGKTIWSTKSRAEISIQKYIINGKLWWLDTSRVWRSSVGDYGAVAPDEVSCMAHEIRKKWAEKNLTTMPLREYMVFEHRRANAK